MTGTSDVRDWRRARQVLCMRLDGMGDVLMTTPAFRALRGAGSGRRLTLLTSRSGASVAPYIAEVDETIVFDAPWMKPGGSAPAHDAALIAELKKRRFDAGVIFTVYSQSPLPAAYLCYLADIPLRLAHCRENPYWLLSQWVPDPEPGQRIRHEVQRHLDLVATIGCRTEDERLSFSVPPAARASAARALAAAGVNSGATLVLAHPGASAPSRRYPGVRFAEAMDLISGSIETAAIVFTGSLDEVDLVQGIQRRMKSATYSLAGRLNVAELGALLERAALLVSNNTGPVHIAAALGTPVVDLYALTNPQHAPWQVESEVLFADVPCRFCYKSECPVGHHACLADVDPHAVASAAERLLNGAAETKERPAAATPLALYARAH